MTGGEDCPTIVAVRRDGREFPVELTILTPVEFDGRMIVHAFVRDISERHRAELAIRGSESLYHSLVDSLPVHVIRKDLRGRLTGDASLQQPFWPKVLDTLGDEAALDAIMHAGMSNVWAAHFGVSVDENSYTPDQTPGFLEAFRTRFPTLRSDPDQLSLILTEGKPVRIGTTAGGISAFHRSFYERAGGYDEIFNPFGFEDSEFGFRMQTAGFNHYLVPKLTAIHGRGLSIPPRFPTIRSTTQAR